MLTRLLLRLEPERAHETALRLLRVASLVGLGPRPKKGVQPSPLECMGLQFPNRIGLAAGLDKNGDYLDALATLGFGFIELGTITPRPQPGNPPPRVFRIPQCQGLINRLGFNNKGVEYLLGCVARSQYRGVLGINIGKNRDTPIERAVEDYCLCLRQVYAHASYVVVNVSSPNTPRLRSLQQGQALDELLDVLTAQRQELATQHGRRVPLVIKIAPDIEQAALPEFAEKLLSYGIDGLTATNTTVDRSAIAGQPQANEAGGLSGRPLFSRSTAVLQRLREAVGNRMALIGVGGVVCGADAQRKICAGADLIQLYTGLIYRGPRLIGECIDAVETRGTQANATAIDRCPSS